MSDSAPSAAARGQRYGLLIAMSSCLAVAALIHGLTLPLLSLILKRHGVDGTLIGINTAAQYLSVFIAAPFVTPLLRRCGPAVMMVGSVVAAALVFVILPIYIDVYFWFALRLILGIALSFLWIAGEAWVCHIAEEGTRGRVVAVYAAVTSVGFALGPLLLAGVGSEGWTPFLVSAGLMLVAALPLGMMIKDSPRLEGRPSGGLLKFVFLAPVAMGVYLLMAAGDAVLLTFLPIYAMHAGLPEVGALSLLTVMALGVIVTQLPIGWLADHMNCMTLMLLAVVTLAFGAAALPWAISSTPWNAVLLLVVGAAYGAIYSISLVLVGRRFKGADLGPVMTARSILFCVGSMAGPPISGGAMDWVGPDGLPWSLLVMCLLVLPLPVVGLIRRWVA